MKTSAVLRGALAAALAMSSWSGSALALAYFLLHMTWRLPEPYWLISVIGFLPLLVVQRSINALNAAVAPDAPRNDSYSGLNILMIVVGGLFLLLVIWGTLLPPLQPSGQVPVNT